MGILEELLLTPGVGAADGALGTPVHLLHVHVELGVTLKGLLTSLDLTVQELAGEGDLVRLGVVTEVVQQFERLPTLLAAAW